VGIGITEQQSHLEEQHAGGPDGGRTAEPRENLFGDEGLNLEQKEGADEDG
jgi:hypothetical protein